MKKTVVVMGTGAQGGTIAMRLNDEPNVGKIICADNDFTAARRYEKALAKAEAVKVDARDADQVAEISLGADLIVNGLPPEFNPVVMHAALENGLHYQDMASGPVADIDFVGAVKRQLALDARFKSAGLSALINTGSAPGLVNVVARNAADKLDQVVCE